MSLEDTMIKRLLVITALGISVSGCFMAPLALLGPATSGFSTASLIQSGVTSGTSYIVKQTTGKTITEHVIGSISTQTLQQSYVPQLKTKHSSKLNPKNKKFLNNK